MIGPTAAQRRVDRDADPIDRQPPHIQEEWREIRRIEESGGDVEAAWSAYHDRRMAEFEAKWLPAGVLQGTPQEAPK